MFEHNSQFYLEILGNIDDQTIPEFYMRNSYNNTNCPNLFEETMCTEERSKSHFPFISNFVPKPKPKQTDISPTPFELVKESDNDINDLFSLSFQEENNSDFGLETRDSDNYYYKVRREINRCKTTVIANNNKYQDYDDFLTNKAHIFKNKILNCGAKKSQKCKKETVFTKAIKSYLEKENSYSQKQTKHISLLGILETSLDSQLNINKGRSIVFNLF